MTLQQIADHMLVPKKTPLPLDFHVYILKQDHEHAHEEVDLTRPVSFVNLSKTTLNKSTRFQVLHSLL